MLPNSIEGRLKELKEIDRKITRLSQISSVLGWDQETYMPPKALEERSNQLALIQGMIHELSTMPIIGALTSELEGATLPTEADRALVRLHRRNYERQAKLSKEFVERRAQTTSKGQAIWAQARQNDRFKDFAPTLKELVDLAREEADSVGWEAHPYDALLDVYEPFTTSAQVKTVFDGLERPVADLVRAVGSKPQVDSSVLGGHFPVDVQERVGREIVREIGFDFEAGRLDVTTHPFCTTLGPQDVRITTRYDERFFNTALYGMIHETGHALYEQGVSPSLAGSILGGGTSLGIHESQSRFWENSIGRSRAFIERYFPLFQKSYGSTLQGLTADAFYKAINRVEPSFIRVEADEVTYTLHIVLRFRLEMALLEGSLKASDVPEAWNAEFEKLFGLRPKSDAQGCLQDIHWSMGGIGYFPTYALGNLYAAQFFHTMKKSLGNWETLVLEGNFSPILRWLRENIHQHGCVYPAGELCKRVTGEPLNGEYFLNYLREKVGGVYGL